MTFQAFKSYLRPYKKAFQFFFKTRGAFIRSAACFPPVLCAEAFTEEYQTENFSREGPSKSLQPNPLLEYFQNKTGRVIYKWEHYFEVYQRHFSRFVDQKVNVLEIGLWGGGSLEMWQAYFGSRSHIYGVDINPLCKAYESKAVSIWIGDQADRKFWRSFKENVPAIDILIDDGGHTPEQQRITLEEMLPHLRPGGVYLCEDIHNWGDGSEFAIFASSLVLGLNKIQVIPNEVTASSLTPYQSAIHSIHFYPYLLVIEKRLTKQDRLLSPMHGTESPPF